MAEVVEKYDPIYNLTSIKGFSIAYIQEFHRKHGVSFEEMDKAWKHASEYRSSDFGQDEPMDNSMKVVDLQDEFCSNLRGNALSYSWNDIGAGELFAETYRDSVYYVTDARQWAFYTGKVWKIGAQAEVAELSKQLTSQVLPALASGIDDDTQRMAWLKWCGRMQSNNARTQMLESASTIPGIVTTLDSFDADSRYLALSNGILDLTKLELLQHDKKYKLSKMTSAKYNSAAKCERWEKFIQQITCYNNDLARFLQIAKGYTLLGKPVEDCLFIELGVTTRNGKSTLERAILNVYGDYAKTASPETLAVNRYKGGNTSSPDLARLKGVRYVNMPEPPKGLELDGSLVKQLTGRDPIIARNLYQGFFEYIPQFVIWINSNYRPLINDMTLFTSGRVFCIPFDAQFPEIRQDKNLLEQFAQPEAMSAILNWLIEGLQLYRREGLRYNIPSVIVSSTQAYEDDSDSFGAFLNDFVLECEGDFALSAEIYSLYKRWAKAEGYRQMSLKSMVSEMKRRGYRDKKKSHGNGFSDIALIQELPVEWD